MDKTQKRRLWDMMGLEERVIGGTRCRLHHLIRDWQNHQ
jgi:hypothetical protein